MEKSFFYVTFFNNVIFNNVVVLYCILPPLSPLFSSVKSIETIEGENREKKIPISKVTFPSLLNDLNESGIIPIQYSDEENGNDGLIYSHR